MARKKREVVKGGTVKPRKTRSKKVVKQNFFVRTWNNFVNWLKR